MSNERKKEQNRITSSSTKTTPFDAKDRRKIKKVRTKYEKKWGKCEAHGYLDINGGR